LLFNLSNFVWEAKVAGKGEIRDMNFTLAFSTAESLLFGVATVCDEGEAWK
jgi:hypothetical protein